MMSASVLNPASEMLVINQGTSIGLRCMVYFL